MDEVLDQLIQANKDQIRDKMDYLVIYLSGREKGPRLEGVKRYLQENLAQNA